MFEPYFSRAYTMHVCHLLFHRAYLADRRTHLASRFVSFSIVVNGFVIFPKFLNDLTFRLMVLLRFVILICLCAKVRFGTDSDFFYISRYEWLFLCA